MAWAQCELDTPYDLLFEASPSAILMVDRDGHIVDCNGSACHQLARSRSELLGSPVLRWMMPEDRARCKTYFLKAFEGATAEWRARVLRGDGVPRLYGFRAVSTKNPASPEPLIVFLDERRIDQKGGPDEGQLHEVLENLPDQFVLVLDQQGRIRYCNGVERVLGYKDEVCLGRELTFLTESGEAEDPLLEQLSAAAADGQSWDGTIWFNRTDGSRIPVQLHSSPYRDPRVASVVGAMLLGRDVSAEHEVREALVRADRFSRIGELVVSVARELEEPLLRLADVPDRIRAVSKKAGKRDAGLAEELALELAAGLGDVGRLVESLRAFATDARVEREPVDVARVIADVAREVEQSFVGGVEIEIAPMQELPRIQMSPAHLRQVLGSVLANAGKALEERGHGLIRIEAEGTAAGLALRIQDNGPGVPEERLEQFFEPFFTTREGHLGLGLPTARGIIEAYGGRIAVGRTGDRWTTFSIMLPTELPRLGAAFRPVPLVLRRARSILIVDDDKNIRVVIRKFLEKIGYRVLEARSGRSALATLTSSEPPEIVISDLKMADGTGYWFLRKLARDFPEVLRRTVILTGDPEHSSVEELRKETGCPVVRKPFDFQELVEVLDEVALRG